MIICPISEFSEVVVGLDETDREVIANRQVQSPTRAGREGCGPVSGSGQTAAEMRCTHKDLRERLRSVTTSLPDWAEVVTWAGQVRDKRKRACCRSSRLLVSALVPCTELGDSRKML